ncbi:MAG: hypothetical protein ACRC92_25890 [Peptostreptococcaceae bacterium]
MKLGYRNNGEVLYYDGDRTKFEHLIDVICGGLCELDRNASGETYGIDLVDIVCNTNRYKWMYRHLKDNVFGLQHKAYGSFLNNFRSGLLEVLNRHFDQFHTMPEKKYNFLNNAKVILIDGCDCAGKNTLSKELRKELTDSDTLVRVIEAPDYEQTLAGIMLKPLLTGDYKISNLGEVISALMVFDRLETFSSLFGQHIESLDDVIFILDRGYTSNVLYSSINNIDVSTAISGTMSLELRHMPKPQLFFLCYPINDIQKEIHIMYLHNRAMEKGLDKNERDYSLQEAVIETIEKARKIDSDIFGQAKTLGIVTNDVIQYAIGLAKEKFKTEVTSTDNK